MAAVQELCTAYLVIIIFLIKFIIISWPDFTGCRYGADPVWDIVWANTPAGQTDTQRCPASLSECVYRYVGASESTSC